MQLKHLQKDGIILCTSVILFFFIRIDITSQNLLSGCESVAYDSIYNRYLVSSLLSQRIIAIDKEGNQSIFKQSIPSFGNCITDSVLYVAGGTNVRGIDLETGELVMNVNFPGTVQLDGVTVDKNGYLYVVATRSDKIIKLNLSDETQTILVDGGLATAPQDIIYDDSRNRLLVCHFQRNAPIIAIDPDDGTMDTVAILEPGFSDGITVDADGNVYVGSYDDGGKIYMFDGDFKNPPALIATNMGEPAGIDVNRIDNVLAVPSFAGNSVTFIQLPAVYLNGNLSADITTGHAPLAVQFNDLSSSNPGINSWKWDFDNDGATDSEEQNPYWTFNEPGHYSVKLTVESDSLVEEIIYEKFVHVFNGESAIELPGSGSYVLVNQSESLIMGSEWTLEGWVNPSNMNAKNILDNGTVNLYTNRNSSSIYKKNSLGIKFIKDDGSAVRFSTSDSSITQDTWNHFALSYNYGLSRFKVYINGNEEELTVTDSLIFDMPLIGNNDSPLIIGNNITYLRGLLGVIDELRIWNVARSGEDIRSTMEEYLTGNESGLAAYWKMNEGTGSEILDLTGNGNSGVITECIYSDGIDFSIFTSNGDYNTNTGAIPDEYLLAQNYPNPFNPATIIEFQLPVSGHVQLDIYNLSGELITTLVNREFAAGYNRVVWNGRNNQGFNATSGIYFYRIIAGSFSTVRKMILVR